MVRIVTGKIDSGKTTRLLEIYRRLGKGDGIIAKKYMIGSDVFGFNAVALSSGSERPYLIHEKQIECVGDDTKFADRIGPYLIFADTQQFIQNYYQDLIDRSVSPLFFDEVGKLEVTGRGYSQAIKNALIAHLDIYLTIREDLIEAVTDYFGVSEFEIISR